MTDIIFIRQSNVIRRISLNDVIYAVAVRGHIQLHTTKDHFTLRSSMREVEGKLPKDKFIRIHRHYIVAIARIDTIEENCVVIGRKLIPISEGYRLVFFQRINPL